MTDTPDDNDSVAATEAEPSGPRAGERLRAAREERKITILEVAKELHLDETKVRALEKNDFDVLGAPVFAKGFLRKYAQLVGVSADDVVADYYDLERSAAAPPVIGAIRRPRREIAPVPWFAAVVIIIAVAFTYWFFAIRPDAGPVDRAVTQPVRDEPVADRLVAPGEDAAEAPAASPVETIQDAVPGGVEPDEATEPEATPGADEAPEPQAVPDAAPADTADEPPAGDDVTLTVRFTGDCWTEITDANGERLFFELGRDGRVVDVTGEAPLSVLFGNADNVSLEVDGVDFPIAAASRRGQTARLTIVAP